jgi:transcription antitermination factor NusG
MVIVPSPHWYALNVRTSREHSVSLHLLQLGIPGYLPLCAQHPDRHIGRRRQDSPLFPGYLFCNTDLRTCPKLYQIPGFIRIVGAGKRPLSIDDSEIEIIQSVLKSAVRIDPDPHLYPGDTVVLSAGPFVGVSGVFSHTRGLKSVVVSLPLLNRSLEVTVPPNWVVPSRLSHSMLVNRAS